MCRRFVISGFAVLAGVAPLSFGQAVPTAIQRLQVSTFGGVSGVHTGFDSGRNLDTTVGVDLGFLPHYSLFPSLEVRGTYPVDKGQVDSQKNILVGPKVALHYGRIHPYGDFLFGRGQINYQNGATNPVRTAFYVQSVSNVFSPGAGLDFELNEHFALKADAQFERYSSPVTDSRHPFAKIVTFGNRVPFHLLIAAADKVRGGPVTV